MLLCAATAAAGAFGTVVVGALPYELADGGFTKMSVFVALTVFAGVFTLVCFYVHFARLQPVFEEVSAAAAAAAFAPVYMDEQSGVCEGVSVYALQAKATARVDVPETPVFGTEYEHEGKSVKEPSVPEVFPVFVRSLLGPHLVFLVSDCTPVSSLVLDIVARTGVPEHLFGLVVEGKVVAEELTLSECGVRKDMTLCMTARLRGGSNSTQQRGALHGGAGQWFCVACQLGGCYAVRTRCFRCGLSRQESERAMGSSAPSSWPLPPGPVQNGRQPRIVPPREVSHPGRPQAGPSFQTAPTFRLPRNKGNKQPNPNPAPVHFPQLVELLTQIGCSTEVMDEVRNRVSGLAPPADSAADKQRKLGDLLDRQTKAQRQLVHLQGIRDKRVEQLSVAEETLAKQEAYIVELTEQVRVAKLATKTPPESEVGAESSVDSDLKSHADESMAGEQEDPVFPPEFNDEPTQGKKRKMVAKAKAAPFIAKNFGQTREFWDKLNSESQQWLIECMQADQQSAPSQVTPEG